MTYEEAIKILNGDFSEVELKEGESHSDLFQQAFRMAIEALKKHTPTKPNWLYDDEPLCPYCQCVLDEYEEVCGECTQLIDWSGV